jgi:CO/xanthine dehydrogenase FAD-binding subunit
VKSAPFQYTRTASVGEACDLLARHGDEAKLLAGGQSLVPMMAMRLLRPAWLVDINEIGALKHVTFENAWCRIGAGMRQVVLERDAALAERVPMLRQALAFVGHVQTRNRGTLGGSLAHADPSAELPLVAQALGARLVLRSKARSRMLTAEQFFTGAMSTALRADECLEEVQFPVWQEARSGSAFEEHSIRHGDFAIVAAAAQVALDPDGRCRRASFGLGGVGLAPVAFPHLCQKLVGAKLDDSTIADAADEAARECDPNGDLHASPEYRRHLARVLAGRALRAARERAAAA